MEENKTVWVIPKGKEEYKPPEKIIELNEDEFDSEEEIKDLLEQIDMVYDEAVDYDEDSKDDDKILEGITQNEFRKKVMEYIKETVLFTMEMETVEEIVNNNF